MRQEFILSKNRASVENVTRFLSMLPADNSYRVEVSDYRPRRSEQQNRYLWGVCYPTILRGGGEALGGWTADDLHEFFLGEHFGVDVLEIGNKTYERPRQRSSRLNKQDFADYVAYLHRRAANMGIVIPDPNEYLTP